MLLLLSGTSLSLLLALDDLDPIYFAGDLPEGRDKSGNWVLRWQNCEPEPSISMTSSLIP